MSPEEKMLQRKFPYVFLYIRNKAASCGTEARRRPPSAAPDALPRHLGLCCVECDTCSNICYHFVASVGFVSLRYFVSVRYSVSVHHSVCWSRLRRLYLR